jgi:hypothetical protein
MATADSYLRELESIKAALKRNNAQAKILRTKKKTAEERLYNYMVRHHIEEVDGYKLEKIAPKPKIPRKKESEKREDAIRFFSQNGIPDPLAFFEEFKSTQKPMFDEDS